MNDTVQQFYYGKIKDESSLENDVDSFWLNLLPEYFQKKLKYGISFEERPLPQSTKAADWTVRYIIKSGSKKVIFMGNPCKDINGQTALWMIALDQVTRYMSLVRAESDQSATETLYGAVNIGTYTRFYQLDPYKQECADYPGTNGECYELAENEAEIHAILQDLVHKTSNGVNYTPATSRESVGVCDI